MHRSVERSGDQARHYLEEAAKLDRLARIMVRTLRTLGGLLGTRAVRGILARAACCPRAVGRAGARSCTAGLRRRLVRGCCLLWPASRQPLPSSHSCAPAPPRPAPTVRAHHGHAAQRAPPGEQGVQAQGRGAAAAAGAGALSGGGGRLVLIAQAAPAAGV